MTVRGRLAPSPTGVLHVGNARTFLLAWLDARSRGGRVLLRVEDLDGPRVKSEAAERAIDDLAWLGLDWDEGPVFQKPRLERYRSALERLAAAGLAYPCVCTRKDVEAAASAPHAGDEGPIYPGTCRGRFASEAAAREVSGREPCWRFAVASGTHVAVEDRFRGPCAWEVDRELGDFVVWKRDGEPAYQLAVVVDDGDQEVSDVLRADDLLPSTARQILLYEALDRPAPSWAHTPLVVGADGRRLAKRHGDTTVRRYRDAGVLPETVVGWLAAGSGLTETAAPIAAAELVSAFRLERVPNEPWTWIEPGS